MPHGRGEPGGPHGCGQRHSLSKGSNARYVTRFSVLYVTWEVLSLLLTFELSGASSILAWKISWTGEPGGL